jgi:hypothetical protein
MLGLIRLLSPFVGLLLAVGVICFFAIKNGRGRSSSGDLVRRFARWYLRRNPKAKRRELEDALRRQFMPKQPGAYHGRNPIPRIPFFGRSRRLIGGSLGLVNQLLVESKYSIDQMEMEKRIEEVLDEMTGPHSRRRPAREEDDEPPQKGEPWTEQDEEGIPPYLWLAALLPGLLLFSLSGCVVGLFGMAAVVGLGAIAVALIHIRQLSLEHRLAGVLALHGLGLLGTIGLVVIMARFFPPTRELGPSGVAMAPTSPAPAPAPTAQAPPPAPAPAPPAPAPAPAPAPVPPSTPAPAPPPAPQEKGPSLREQLERAPQVFLSDLQEFDIRSGPWPVSKNGVIAPEKLPITVRGVRSPKGLGMHPPNAPDFAAAKYHLDKQAGFFAASVALNDTAQIVQSSAVFEVHGDGKRLWRSQPVGKGTKPQDCRIDVSNVDVLELRVASQGSHFGLHAVWLEPRLLPKADAPRR